jgi:hypothetical protein
MTIRELINILIDAPEKDKEVCVEYRQREVEANNDGYEWNQLEATQAVIHGGDCTIEVHPYKEKRNV